MRSNTQQSRHHRLCTTSKRLSVIRDSILAYLQGLGVVSIRKAMQPTHRKGRPTPVSLKNWRRDKQPGEACFVSRSVFTLFPPDALELLTCYAFSSCFVGKINSNPTAGWTNGESHGGRDILRPRCNRTVIAQCVQSAEAAGESFGYEFRELEAYL